MSLSPKTLIDCVDCLNADGEGETSASSGGPAVGPPIQGINKQQEKENAKEDASWADEVPETETEEVCAPAARAFETTPDL